MEKKTTIRAKKNTTTTAKKVVTKGQILDQAKEDLEKLAKPIILKSPLQYKAGTVVLTELDQKDVNQLMFAQLGTQTTILTNMLMTVNDLLLLFEAYAKKMGLPTEKIVNGKVMDYTADDYKSGQEVANRLGVDKK